METINENAEKIPMASVVRVPVPNSQGVLILGIFSLVITCCCFGIGVVGLALGIIAVVLSSKALDMYGQNPKAYTEASYKNLNGGRICGIIGIVANGAMILFAIVYLVFMGAGLTALFSEFPWEDYF
jgi:hypothetical protein